MSTDLLKRNLAPIVTQAWSLIDEEAARVLTQNLAARKVVDLKGPHGWQKAAVNTGRLNLLDGQPAEGVHVGLREVLPLVEVRAPMRLPVMELDLVARGCEAPELEVVVKTAEKVAHMEDAAIFDGYGAANIQGIIPASPHPAVEVAAITEWPAAILDGIGRLRQSGVSGPYSLVLGSKHYEALLAATVDGYPIAKQIQRLILDGEIVHAPGLSGAVLLSVRGGDYELVVGQDLSIGYATHDRDEVELYLTESFTFRVLEPAAAICMKPAEGVS
jgi:uncharacterized linocin/CFP29 family protein